MRILWIAGAMLALAGATPAQAQIVERWDVIGQGNNTCGEWTQDKQENGTAYLANKSWVVGALSGINAMRGGDILRSSNVAGAMGWIDNYCAAQPLDTISTAVRRLVEELSRRG